MSKIWFVKVTRELEDPFETHVKQDTEPTKEQIKGLFEEVCVDSWDSIGRITVEEIKL